MGGDWDDYIGWYKAGETPISYVISIADYWQ